MVQLWQLELGITQIWLGQDPADELEEQRSLKQSEGSWEREGFASACHHRLTRVRQDVVFPQLPEIAA